VIDLADVNTVTNLQVPRNRQEFRGFLKMDSGAWNYLGIHEMASAVTILVQLCVPMFVLLVQIQSMRSEILL
jgi:hypothetical protein